VRYLCAKHGDRPRSIPQDLCRRFDAERWMDWQQTTLNPAGSPAFKQWIRTRRAERDPAVIERSRAATDPLLALLDAHLATRPWMAGERFTMADIPIGCDIHRWWGLPQAAPGRTCRTWSAGSPPGAGTPRPPAACWTCPA
jgi:glutathione S-transferase